MSKLATISLNFSDGEKEYINTSDNPLKVINHCILAAGDDRAIYSIEHTHLGYEVRRKTPGQRCHEYVSAFRNGEYTWRTDYLYAKHYSFDTAVKHVLELYRRDNA